MKRETNAMLVGFVVVAFIVMNTNSAIGNGQLEAALINAQNMTIERGPRKADMQATPEVENNIKNAIQADMSGKMQIRGMISANFGENTENVDANNVFILQTYLAANGYLKDKYVTGEFGAITKQAVKDFQIANNIEPASGFVGDMTRQKINAAISSN